MHEAGHISPDLGQLLLLTAGGLLFGLILKAMHWQRFQGPAAAGVAMEDMVGHTLPVVEDSKSMRLVGSVAESDFISAYRLAVEQERDGQEDKETAQSSTD